jgi:hypothetical protein
VVGHMRDGRRAAWRGTRNAPRMARVAAVAALSARTPAGIDAAPDRRDHPIAVDAAAARVRE